MNPRAVSGAGRMKMHNTAKEHSVSSEVVNYVQLAANVLALFAGAGFWRLYIRSLEQNVATKDSQIEFWRDKAGDMEKQSPEAFEKRLSDRIRIREEEIARLEKDQESSAEAAADVKAQKESLSRTLEQARGFQRMLELEQGDLGDVADMEELFEGAELDVRLLGYVAVDSGQLMIADPCYIDSEWQKEPVRDIRRYVDMRTKDILQFGKDFTNFQEVLPVYGKSVNELIAEEMLVELPEDSDSNRNFSYAGACAATNSEGYGELRFRMGYAGAGLAFSTAFGDGMFPVYGEMRGANIVRVYMNVV